MSSKNRFKFLQTLAFRLTLGYAGIFSISAGVVFFLFYFLLTSIMLGGIDQELLSRSKELTSLFNVNGIAAVNRVVSVEAQAAGEKKIFVRLLYPNGTTFSSSNMSYWKDIGISRNALGELAKNGDPRFETISIPNRKHQVRILYSIIGPATLLQLGQSMENHTRLFEAFQKIFLFVMIPLIFFSALIGWFMARRATKGVEEVTKTARFISQGAMDERVPLHQRDDEIDQLAVTFNHMLDRIQALVINIKEISDNIAHDLRSPITRIRGLAEVTLTTANSQTEFEIMAASTIEECDRLLDMINTMLVISKTEAGVQKTDFQDVDMALVLKQACELFTPMAEDKGLKLACHLNGKSLIKGDLAMIQRMVANLIDNAIKYTPSGGQVDLRMGSDHQAVCVDVSDTGIGISEQDLPRIFDRFYRCDQSRSLSGTGLGLSLVKAVAESHGGNIIVSSIPGRGSTFLLTLPQKG